VRERCEGEEGDITGLCQCIMECASEERRKEERRKETKREDEKETGGQRSG
jgi:hypothetical protein